jgi:hypothetical protein
MSFAKERGKRRNKKRMRYGMEGGGEAKVLSVEKKDKILHWKEIVK